MNRESLIPGLKFVAKHQLTQKEIYVLTPFLEREDPYSNKELSVLLEYHRSTLHHIIKRLKLRQLIIKVESKKRNHLYRLNQEMLN